MTDDNKKYLIGLHSFPKFGPVRLKKIFKHFPDLKIAFEAATKELMAAGIEENIANEFISARRSIDIDKILAVINRENIKILTFDDPLYPKLLKEIYDPPVLLYYKGEMEEEEFTIAVVGTRKITAYGQQVTEKMVRGLVNNKITVVSGLALGVDTIAHNTTLNYGGRTIAVLGTGLDKQSIYPGVNRYLAEKIAANRGAVISEFPFGTAPLKHNFPQRNRIISGLSLGVLVVEAGEKSGALITARHALDQNRDVFAVPGNIFSPVSAGPNLLIKQGAKTVSEAGEILEALDLASINNYIENKKILPESKEEEKIIACLSFEPVHIDDLIHECNLSAPIVNSTLIIMEMKGMVKNLGGMKYVLAR